MRDRDSNQELDRPYTREPLQIEKHRYSFLFFAFLLILLGIGAVSASAYTTFFSVILLGFLLLAAGVVQIVQAVMAHNWNGVFFSLLIGILYLVTGFLCVTRPEVTAIGLTFWIAAFCFIAGLFRMFSSLILRFTNWEWVFANGLITFILGLMIYQDWPLSGLWVIGLFVGLDMILTGWSWIMLSCCQKNYK